MTRRLFSERTSRPVPAERADRILVVRVDERVGNLVSLQSLLDALRHALPGAKLGLLSSSRAAQVADRLQGIDWLHKLDKRWFFKRHGLWRKKISEVRSIGYQVALDASAWHEFSFTHAALTYYSGAPVRIGFDRGIKGGFHTILVTPGPPGEHELAQRMRLVRPLGIEMEPPELRSSMGEEQREGWEKWLTEKGAGRPRVAIWAGSRKQERRWPLDYYIALGRRLLSSGAGSLVVLWGPGEEVLRDRLVSAIPKGLIAAPKTSLEELAALMRGVDLVVTNDTGPMHLAVAVETATVCFFASGDPGRWGHPYSRVINLVAPGSNNGEVEEALDACRRLLAGVEHTG